MAKGRKKQPRELAKIKGLDKKNPQRYRTEPPKSDFALGAAPSHMSKGEKKVWDEIVKYSLPGVLTGAERIIVETLAKLVYEFRNPPDKGFPAAKLGRMIQLLSSLGMTPVDRQRLGVQPPANNDPSVFEEF